MMIFDFVHGQVIDSAKDPQAARDLLEAAAKQAREVKVAAGGVPAGSAA
jgi:hypothetical protein